MGVKNGSKKSDRFSGWHQPGSNRRPFACEAETLCTDLFFAQKIGHCTAFHVRTRQVHGSNPGGTKIVKIVFDFFSGTVSRLQLILRTLDNCYSTIFSLNTLDTVPEIKILRFMCCFANETREK